MRFAVSRAALSDFDDFDGVYADAAAHFARALR
jgi:hypothetical protein